MRTRQHKNDKNNEQNKNNTQALEQEQHKQEQRKAAKNENAINICVVCNSIDLFFVQHCFYSGSKSYLLLILKDSFMVC